jgi:hypothetical protein
MRTYKSIYEKITLPLDKGQEILVGKFRNQKATLKGVEVDEKGNIIFDTTKGKKKVPFRVPALAKESVDKTII